MTKVPLIWRFLYPSTTNKAYEFVQEDFNAQKVGYAIKEIPFKGYVFLSMNGNGEKISKKFYDEDRPELRTLILKSIFWLIEKKIVSLQIDETPIALVPVPNHDTILRTNDFKTARDTNLLAQYSKGRLVSRPYLRWKTKQQQSHDGGTRDATVLENNLRLSETIPEKNVSFFTTI